MKRAGGKSVQGYNAQVVASPEQVILAAQVTQSQNDADQLEPMVAHLVETLREAGIEEPIGTVLADGGYWNSPAISGVRGRGIDVLVPTRDRLARFTVGVNRSSSPSLRTPRSSDVATTSSAAPSPPAKPSGS